MRYFAVLVGLLAACSSHDRTKPMPAAPHDAQTQRVIPPPTSSVRALPPHAIRADGVGPYLLGDPINELLHSMPGGPILLRFDIPGLVRTGVVRAEDDQLIVGGEPGALTTYVAVIGNEDIARTESGIHVGSTRAELAKATDAMPAPGSAAGPGPGAGDGRWVDDPTRMRDPRLVGTLQNVLAIFDGTAPSSKLEAFLVMPDGSVPAAVPTAACTRPVPPAAEPDTTGFGMCLSAQGELVEVSGDTLTIKVGDGSRTLATVRISDIAFVAPLRALEDGRDDLIVVTHTASADEQRWAVVAYRLEAGKVVRVAEADPAFRLTDQETRWIGAQVREVGLYLQLASRADGIEVGGVLVTQSNGAVRDIAPVTAVVIPRGHGITKLPAGDGSGSGNGAGSAAGSGAGSATTVHEGPGSAAGAVMPPPAPREGSGRAQRPTLP